jgi:hypothetical protein
MECLLLVGGASGNPVPKNHFHDFSGAVYTFQHRRINLNPPTVLEKGLLIESSVLFVQFPGKTYKISLSGHSMMPEDPRRPAASKE